MGFLERKTISLIGLKYYGGHVRTGLLPGEMKEIKFESPVTIIRYEILLTKAFAVLCSLCSLAL